MPTQIIVPEGYGYVVLVALGLVPLLSAYHGSVVTGLRKPAKIPYPNCYATSEQAKSSPEAYKFNCAQRAHANFLENAPINVVTMLVAGLVYPMTTVGLGLGWLVSRILYLVGYVYSGKENGGGRRIGGTFWLFQGGIWGLCVSTAWGMI